MGVLLFLLVPLAVIVVGSLVLTVVNHKPQSMRSSMRVVRARDERAVARGRRRAEASD